MSDKEKMQNQETENADINEETVNASEETIDDSLETKEAASVDDEDVSENETEDAEENAEEVDETEAENQGGDKKFFKKKAKADKKADAMKEKVEELEDKVKRQLAEFENFRNRTEKEKTQMFETGAKSVIEKILPVVDNFERGLASVPEEEKGKPFADGMEMIYKQLMTELDKMDVKPIESVGLEFNPDLHNAVMQVESEEYDSGVIAQELQKGYTYHGQVVRHSMVAVVQ